MRISSKISLLLLLSLSLGSMPALADIDKDKDKDKKAQQSDAGLNKSQFAVCNTGSAAVDLDANNVRARLFNNGHLFWKGSGNIYTVPKTGNANAIFASGIWLGGMVGSEMRFAGTDYGPFEFFPGPLDDQGNPPADCSPYDRIYSITKDDMDAFEAGEPHTSDIEDWPWQLGAPVVDGDGDPNNYNLAGGDRPELTGTQTAWWIMNDVAGPHGWSQSAPIGLEVQVTAFAFRRADALNNTTFYKYKLVYKGSQQLTNAYFGIWSDPDLGNAGDDFVGSDTTLGMGYVYNGDDFDDTSVGYGSFPPALGYDFFQGPLVNNDGRDNDGDGEIDEDDERIAMSKFVYYNNDSTPQGNPFTGSEAYGYLRGIWRDGKPITLGGTGYGGDVTVDYMFPGDPTTGAFWSEENTDGAGSRNTPADRRFILSSGPFIMNPGDEQEIVYGIVWAQGADRLASVNKMKADDALAQAAFDVNFQLPSPPDAPRVTASAFDKTVALTWDNSPQSNNYLNSYDVPNPFLADVPDDVAPDKSYTFEGYRVFRYRDENQGDLEGELVATFDVPNDVTTITDTEFDASTGVPITLVVARGNDGGVRHSITFSNLTNYTEYFYGVQAYAFNDFSAPKVLASPVSRVQLMPRDQSTLAGGTNLATEEIERRERAEGTSDISGSKTGKGGGSVTATIVDPTRLTGNTYEVRFYDHCYEVEEAGKRGSQDVPDVVVPSRAQHLAKSQAVEECVTTYDVFNTTTNTKVFDGTQAFQITGEAAPQGTDVLVIDGLSYSIVGPPKAAATIPGVTNYAFVEITGPGGIDACEGRTVLGCPQMGGDLVYASFNSTGDYVMYHAGAGPEEVIGAYSPNDFEIRFTEEGSYAYYLFGGFEAIWVPFEVWDIGPTATATDVGVNDPSDDVQMIPNLFADAGGQCAFDFAEGDDPFGLGWGMSDRIYAYYSTTTYEDWEAVVKPIVDADPNNCPVLDDVDPDAWTIIDLGRGRPIQRVTFNAPADADPLELLEGTVVRFITTKPHLPGDVFAVNTEGLGVVRGDQQTAAAALESIGLVPNPYKGASNYEVSVTDDVVRFTNLPDRARIRVFTLSGTQVWDQTRGAGNNEWDLKTSEGLPLASGMYLVVVEVDGVGKKVIKFGVVKKRIQRDLLSCTSRGSARAAAGAAPRAARLSSTKPKRLEN